MNFSLTARNPTCTDSVWGGKGFCLLLSLSSAHGGCLFTLQKAPRLLQNPKIILLASFPAERTPDNSLLIDSHTRKRPCVFPAARPWSNSSLGEFWTRSGVPTAPPQPTPWYHSAVWYTVTQQCHSTSLRHGTRSMHARGGETGLELHTGTRYQRMASPLRRIKADTCRVRAISRCSDWEVRVYGDIRRRKELLLAEKLR